MGYTEGVTGPLVRAAQLWGGMKVTVLPGVVAPEGAGGDRDVDCPWAARRCQEYAGWAGGAGWLQGRRVSFKDWWDDEDGEPGHAAGKCCGHCW
jgi:hypothetical protein